MYFVTKSGFSWLLLVCQIKEIMVYCQNSLWIKIYIAAGTRLFVFIQRNLEDKLFSNLMDICF